MDGVRAPEYDEHCPLPPRDFGPRRSSAMIILPLKDHSILSCQRSADAVRMLLEGN